MEEKELSATGGITMSYDMDWQMRGRAMNIFHTCKGYCTTPVSHYIDYDLQLLINLAHTTPASHYIDYDLQLLINSAHKVLWDTSQVVRCLLQLFQWMTRKKKCSPLIITDVESLYTNMPWNATIEALNGFLSEADCPMRSLPHSLAIITLKIFFSNTKTVSITTKMGWPWAHRCLST